MPANHIIISLVDGQLCSSLFKICNPAYCFFHSIFNLLAQAHLRLPYLNQHPVYKPVKKNQPVISPSAQLCYDLCTPLCSGIENIPMENPGTFSIHFDDQLICQLGEIGTLFAGPGSTGPSVLLTTPVEVSDAFTINGQVKLRLGEIGTLFAGPGSTASDAGISTADKIEIAGDLEIGNGSTITWLS